MGPYDENDDLCLNFSNKANCLVVSVAYRLASEHPYPAPIEDCYQIILKGYINNFLVAGGVLLGFGQMVVTLILKKENG